MTGVDAIKKAVDWWWEEEARIRIMREIPTSSIRLPEHIKTLCRVIHKLKHEVFNVENGEWEYEGF